MNVLFITSSRIGDAVLSTGLLDHIAREHPDARVTMACGPLVAPLFEGYSNLKEIIPLKKQKHNKHWLELWKQVIGTRWDMVVDLRNSAVSRMIRAKRRFVFGNHIDKNLHKVEQNAAVMKLERAPSPRLWFSQQQQEHAEDFISGREPVLGVGPTSNWLGKTWPAENFKEIVYFLTRKEGLMPGARVAVFAAPGEEEAAREVLTFVARDRRIDMIAKTDPGTAAAVAARCSFYIGNDSGLMHCAAAAGVPTIGLFGPSHPHLYRPWGPHADYVQTPESFDELVDYEGYAPGSAPCLMETLTTEAVKDKIQKFWKAQKAA